MSAPIWFRRAVIPSGRRTIVTRASRRTPTGAGQPCRLIHRVILSTEQA
jgi:hypothetical protein